MAVCGYNRGSIEDIDLLWNYQRNHALLQDTFLDWIRPKNRSIVLFYANGLGNQRKAKLNFQRAAVRTSCFSWHRTQYVTHILLKFTL